MSETCDHSQLRQVLGEKINLGKDLIDQLATPNLKKVTGIPKLQKKVRQEVKFLEKFEEGGNLALLKKEHIQCSNLLHLNSIISEIFKVKNPMAVMQPFNLSRKDGSLVKKVGVDIVCEGGDCWVKVVARNPKALDLNSQGGNQYGQRSILDQVKEYVKCSKQNQLMFRTPRVLFVFANGVTKGLANRIQQKGAMVSGDIIFSDELPTASEYNDDEESDTSSSEDEDHADVDNEAETPSADCCGESGMVVPEGIDESTLNLDITAMIAYVSNLTNGKRNYVFKEKILAEQAEWERKRPVKPFLDKVFHGKNLICCESAERDFHTIINSLGGEGEKARAAELIARLTVVPDQESNRTKGLEFSGKIKDRSRSIFGTGDTLKVLTVTANSGFVRAAEGQGVNLAVILHESRALTEDKEKMAIELEAALL